MTITRMQEPRQMYQEGGIMPRLNQLGSGVSSAEQMLQGINERLQSAESSLGSGGGGNIPNQMPPGFGTRPLLSATIDPNFKPQELKAADPNNVMAGAFPSVREAYANAQKEAQESRAGGFLGQVVLPGEMSFEDFSNFYNPSNPLGQVGLSPIQQAVGMADGGIINRQNYGLGSLVKKITKPIKKIVKSPIGKAALLIGGAGLAGFGPAAGLRTSGLGNFLFGGATKFLPGATAAMKGAAVTSPGIFGKAASMFGNLSTGAKLGIGAGVTSLLAASGMGEEEIEETKRDPDKLRIYLKDYFSKLNPNASDTEIEEFVETNVSEYATGGRVGFKDGKNMMMASAPDPADSLNDLSQMLFGKNLDELTDDEYEALQEKARDSLAAGGMPTGIMRTNQAGTMERDYRETGGFVPVGIKEKADDVPAMLSKNEFVMTADAVRGAGDGSIEKGAQRMYDQMKRLENKVA